MGIAWAAGVLDQWSLRAMGIWGGFWYDVDCRCGDGGTNLMVLELSVSGLR